MYILKKISNYMTLKKNKTHHLSLRPHPNSLTTIYIKQNIKVI